MEEALKKAVEKLSARSVIALMLVMGGFGLAVLDKDFRSKFADISGFGIGGYLGQLSPKSGSSEQKKVSGEI